jgi:hypothetical protein
MRAAGCNSSLDFCYLFVASSEQVVADFIGRQSLIAVGVLFEPVDCPDIDYRHRTMLPPEDMNATTGGQALRDPGCLLWEEQSASRLEPTSLTPLEQQYNRRVAASGYRLRLRAMATALACWADR